MKDATQTAKNPLRGREHVTYKLVENIVVQRGRTTRRLQRVVSRNLTWWEAKERRRDNPGSIQIVRE